MTLRKLLGDGARFVRHPALFDGKWFEFFPEGEFLVELGEDGSMGAIGGIPEALLDKEGWESKTSRTEEDWRNLLADRNRHRSKLKTVLTLIRDNYGWVKKSWRPEDEKLQAIIDAESIDGVLRNG